MVSKRRQYSSILYFQRKIILSLYKIFLNEIFIFKIKENNVESKNDAIGFLEKLI